MSNWFECKIKYQKIDEATGKDKMARAAYLFDAVSFTEAEARAYKLLEEEIGGEFTVTNLSPTNIHEILFDDQGEFWYKCKVVFVDVDEKSGKEKKTANYMLVYATNIKDAYTKLEESLNSVLVPWEILSIAQTGLIDVFPYNAEEEGERKPVAEKITSVFDEPADDEIVAFQEEFDDENN